MTPDPDPDAQPDQNPPGPEHPPDQPIDDSSTLTDTSETAARDSGPAEATHTVANPSPIPDYAMEPSVERPAAQPPSDPVDTPPTQRYPDDTALMIPLTVPLTLEPTHPLPPEPAYLAPEPAYLAPEPAYVEAPVRPRRRPLFGTIIWGVILLALAGYVLLGVLVPTPADPTLWLLGGVIVIGVLLVVVGVIAALRRAG